MTTLEQLNSIALTNGRLPYRFSLLSEDDAARCFVAESGELVRYCAAAGGWHIWDGRRFAPDVDGAILRLVSACTDSILENSNRVEDLKKRGEMIRFVAALRRCNGLKHVAELAASKLPVAVGSPEAFDADPWALNVQNGTIDLRTGELQPHDPGALLTKLVPIAFDPSAPCDRWLRFLDEIFAGDTETVDFVQRAAGYSLTGSTREQCFFILHGVGANGKTTLLSMLAAISGEYARSTPIESFVERQPGKVNDDVARLHGARFLSTIETTDGRTLAEGFVKAITGGDRIAARHLFSKYFEFVPSFKIWLATNHKPIIKGGDAGIWRRVRLIPFERSFEGEHSDPDLRAKLDAELPGILAWAVRGALKWQAQGFTAPASVANATAAYRSEMDTFAAFIDDRCIVDRNATANAGPLYADYRTWAESAGEKPLSQRWFGLRLGERGFQKTRTAGGKQRIWTGIRLVCDAYDA